jgi:small subunit ribosomal protein S16
MLKIRLTRIGKRNDPHFRIVVIPSRAKRDGKVIEYIGYLNPKNKEVKLNVKRAKYWLSVGAKPTDTVIGILAKHKLAKPLPRPDRPPKKKKKEIKKEAKEVQPKKEEKVEKKSKKEKPKEEKKAARKEGKTDTKEKGKEKKVKGKKK